MTGVAFLRSIALLVAVNTSGHRQIAFPEQAIALSHLSVAFLAFHAGSQMLRMAEGHIIRQLVHPHPGNLLVIAIESGQLPDRRAIFLNRLVACHAIGGSREAHGHARIGILMAILANKPQRNMLLVTVWNGLLRSLEVRGEAPNRQQNRCRHSGQVIDVSFHNL